jgi:hypothetical protein
MPDKVRIHDLGNDDFFFDGKEAAERIRKALPAVVAINWKAVRKVVELFFVNGQIGGIRKLDHTGGDNA